MKEEHRKAVLCYVDNNWAYFTTQKLEDQWGDDWDDAPYECNSGEPYYWYDGRDEEPYEIVKVAFDGDFETPADLSFDSPYSVQRINAGVVAWLATSRRSSESTVSIHAGVTLDEFIEKIERGGGTVYLPREQ